MPSTRVRFPHPFCLVLLALLAAGPATAAEFFGPAPYLSAADTPEGFASGAMTIEDFEDGVADARLILPGGSSIIGPGGNTDSVDADDGVIDGDGNQGHSLFGANLHIVFKPPYPVAAGMVWTDGTQAALTFEAFGPDGSSLGTVSVDSIGDTNITGQTAEDRFFGVRDAGGIAAIAFVSGSANALMELDHIQFDAEPGIFADGFEAIGE